MNSFKMRRVVNDSQNYHKTIKCEVNLHESIESFLTIFNDRNTKLHFVNKQLFSFSQKINNNFQKYKYQYNRIPVGLGFDLKDKSINFQFTLEVYSTV